MTLKRSVEYLVGLVRELCKLAGESECVEFKVNSHQPQEIGEYVSALSNSAALAGKPFGYVIWGVSDCDHRVVGTSFKPGRTKVGNEELENWMLRLLVPRIHFEFFEVAVDGHPVVILEIERAHLQPVRFSGQEYVRIGSYKKNLKDFPEKERKLWRSFDETPFARRVAAEQVHDEEVLRLLDYPAYFELLERPLPEDRSGILEALGSDGLIHRCHAGGWNVTNLGLVLFARDLEDAGNLDRKAVRIIQYRADSRIATLREEVWQSGYATGFEPMMRFVNGLLPSNEVIGEALRKTVPTFPEPAVRELIANAMIHQDFFVTGAGPMVEIFDNRIEVTNPGAPLVDIQRFLDLPSRCRNEPIAKFMRRIGICEERGSGWDKVVAEIEFYQLPAPLVEVVGDNTRVVLFAPRPLMRMDKKERVRATYLHACLRYVHRQYLTNASMRQRFGIKAQNSARASRLIAESVREGVIAPYDPSVAPKLMQYVPWWAKAGTSSDT